MEGRKVLVAMSGGVDSAVASALLVSRGWEVVGVTLKLWSGPGPAAGGCRSLAAAEDARWVAERLGISHHVLNLSKEFRRDVVEPFIAAYRRGLTPNPCILCNERVKFGALFQRAAALEASHVATGHYARLGRDPGTGRRLILRARDSRKDQTYVLYGLRQRELERVLWPVGELEKAEVRQVARSLGLRVAAKPDSQEICFVGEGDYRGFLRAVDPDSLRPGPIYHVCGNLLGRHQGLPLYTVGQRRGIGVSWPEPLYVIRHDLDRNALIVGPREALAVDGLVATRANFIPFAEIEEPLRATVKVRYGQDEIPAIIHPAPVPDGEEGPAVEVHFERPAMAVAPGQAAVFYRGEVVVGGGTIRTALRGGERMNAAVAGYATAKRGARSDGDES